MSEIEAQLVNQALQDATFRDRLMSDPKTVLAEQGLTIPDDVQIQVFQESSSQYYLVLPSDPASTAPSQISDAELEAVSGGLSWGDDVPPPTQNYSWTGCAGGC